MLRRFCAMPVDSDDASVVVVAPSDSPRHAELRSDVAGGGFSGGRRRGGCHDLHGPSVPHASANLAGSGRSGDGSK
jgi:hypothetical protein